MTKALTLAALIALCGCGNIYSPLAAGNLQPTPVPHVKPKASIDDFEDQNLTDDFLGSNAFWTDSISPQRSTISYDLTVPGSPLPGGTPGAAMRLYGTMMKNVNWPSGGYPYCLLEMTIAQAPGLDIGPLTTKKQLVFHFKQNQLASGGGQYRATITHYPITNYDWYTYQFTAANDLNWHEYRVNFPESAGTPSPKFVQTYGPPIPLPVAWSYTESHVTTVTFQAFSSPSSNFNYDITIDDVRFE